MELDKVYRRTTETIRKLLRFPGKERLNSVTLSLSDRRL